MRTSATEVRGRTERQREFSSAHFLTRLSSTPPLRSVQLLSSYLLTQRLQSKYIRPISISHHQPFSIESLRPPVRLPLPSPCLRSATNKSPQPSAMLEPGRRKPSYSRARPPLRIALTISYLNRVPILTTSLPLIAGYQLWNDSRHLHRSRIRHKE
jgi:hypothetical protein